LGCCLTGSGRTQNTPPSGGNRATASIGFINGEAAGSANPLVSAHGQYVRLNHVRGSERGRGRR